MSRYTERRRSRLGDPRVVTTAVGVLAVAGVVALLPQASDASSDVFSDNAQLAANGVQCVQIGNRRIPVSTDGQRHRFDKNPCRQPAGSSAASSSAAPVTAEPVVVDNQNGGQNNGGNGGNGGGGNGGSSAAQPTGNGQNVQNGQNGQNNGQNGGQQGQNGGQQGQNGAQGGEPTPAAGTNPADTSTPNAVVNPTSTEQPQGQKAADGTKAPQLGILGNNCDNSKLQPHDGFQNGNRCVSTAFGEVANADSNPSLIISSAPRFVKSNQPFDLRVTTKNLLRDRFLAAAQGGYYKESSFLSADGITRGHFHTACRMLNGTKNAPDQAAVPAFFAATEDGKGSRNQDTVTVRVTGLPKGLAQCAVWAGDGSHRVPMMQRANQTPAIDVVRINVV